MCFVHCLVAFNRIPGVTDSPWSKLFFKKAPFVFSKATKHYCGASGSIFPSDSTSKCCQVDHLRKILFPILTNYFMPILKLSLVTFKSNICFIYINIPHLAVDIGPSPPPGKCSVPEEGAVSLPPILPSSLSGRWNSLGCEVLPCCPGKSLWSWLPWSWHSLQCPATGRAHTQKPLEKQKNNLLLTSCPSLTYAQHLQTSFLAAEVWRGPRVAQRGQAKHLARKGGPTTLKWPT